MPKCLFLSTRTSLTGSECWSLWPLLAFLQCGPVSILELVSFSPTYLWLCLFSSAKAPFRFQSLFQIVAQCPLLFQPIPSDLLGSQQTVALVLFGDRVWQLFVLIHPYLQMNAWAWSAQKRRMVILLLHRLLQPLIGLPRIKFEWVTSEHGLPWPLPWFA